MKEFYYELLRAFFLSQKNYCFSAALKWGLVPKLNVSTPELRISMLMSWDL